MILHYRDGIDTLGKRASRIFATNSVLDPLCLQTGQGFHHTCLDHSQLSHYSAFRGKRAVLQNQKLWDTMEYHCWSLGSGPSTLSTLTSVPG
ncbi:hypothetical protein CPSG_05882 [Coccidioides posadasii str. Silveira]|uniref:Uncharacterized protein n=1 Tax=Coccidioides posadasii (strain RMSCC 757 / Silveira) TaxID=443226 RepID=E9D7T0_COCPS|nr:hypothetical protein CPSG_05882 [Coccidioides posadasii str. Silveira]